MSEVYIRTCKDCRVEFETEKPNAMLCPKCKEEHRKKRKQIANNAQTAAVNISLPKMMQLLELYNQNHGTNYSYGQFVSGLRLGKIKIGVVKNE